MRQTTTIFIAVAITYLTVEAQYLEKRSEKETSTASKKQLLSREQSIDPEQEYSELNVRINDQPRRRNKHQRNQEGIKEIAKEVLRDIQYKQTKCVFGKFYNLDLSTCESCEKYCTSDVSQCGQQCLLYFRETALRKEISYANTEHHEELQNVQKDYNLMTTALWVNIAVSTTVLIIAIVGVTYTVCKTRNLTRHYKKFKKRQTATAYYDQTDLSKQCLQNV